MKIIIVSASKQPSDSYVYIGTDLRLFKSRKNSYKMCFSFASFPFLCVRARMKVNVIHIINSFLRGA